MRCLATEQELKLQCKESKFNLRNFMSKLDKHYLVKELKEGMTFQTEMPKESCIEEFDVELECIKECEMYIE